MNLRRTASAVVVTVLLGGLAACGDDGDGEAAPPTTTSSTTAPSSTTAAEVTTTGPAGTSAPTTAGRRSCPAQALPSGATNVVVKPASGDYDGDGAADGLRSYLVGGAWHLRIEPAGGGAADVVVGGVAPTEDVRAIGGTRVDGDSGDEAFAVVGSGAATTIVGLFVLRSCKLEWATLGPDKAALAVGSSASHSDAIACSPPTLVTHSAVLDNNASTASVGAFDTTSITYRLDGITLTETGRTTGKVKSDEPAFSRFQSPSCGSLRLF